MISRDELQEEFEESYKAVIESSNDKTRDELIELREYLTHEMIKLRAYAYAVDQLIKKKKFSVS